MFWTQRGCFLPSKLLEQVPLISAQLRPKSSTRSTAIGSAVGRKTSAIGAGKCIALRRETINAWERRAPLAPKHVRKLTRAGVKVLIQPSNRRAFSIQDYISAGATVSEDLSEASLIMSVKQVPIDDLIPDKTFSFFSHTIKAQKDNMPMLDSILEKNIRLLDYEKLADDRNQRLVAFGKWAGFAGMIDILHGLGLRLLALGHHTPFIHIGLAHNYRDSHMARNAIRDAGYSIALGMMPQSLGPLTFVFTGSGNVSRGAQEIFQDLPYESVDVRALPNVARRGTLNKIYGCIARREDHMVRKDGGPLDLDELEEHPERYLSTFAQTIAPYASVIINGIFWQTDTPRLITIPDAKHLLTPVPRASPDIPGNPTLPHRLLAICDISADPGGSIEFVKDCTTIDKPFCIYDANQNTNSDSFDSPSGVLVCSIDNMPAQMPLEATEYFGERLFPYVFEMMQSDAREPFEKFDVSDVVRDAVIASNGQLTPNFEYINELRSVQKFRCAENAGIAYRSGGARRKVLLLGAGFVSGPVVELLTRNDDVHVTVATEFQTDAEKLTQISGQVTPVIIDVQHTDDKLEKLIGDSDVVISLLPYSFHPMVARMCLTHGTNMVTASYASPEMMGLDSAAKSAGITIVNEVGLDPGIDHLLATECFDNVREHAGKVTSFVSWCGGLPAPECSDNPLRYKFNWNPKGVLLNTLSGAKYKQDGEIVQIPPGGAILDSVVPIDFMPGFSLCGFPNRDSTIYESLYQIEGARTVIRGTLRYEGFTAAAKALQRLNLLSSERHPALDVHLGPEHSWKEFMALLLHQKPDIFIDTLKSMALDKLDGDEKLLKIVTEMGLFDEDVLVDRRGSPIDALTSYFMKQFRYGEGERDIAIMRHDVTVQWPSMKREIQHIDFAAYGNLGGFSAMAETVGYTTAIVTRMILDGEIQQKGMVLPMAKEIYRPVLARLKAEGLRIRYHRTEL
jgi:alpha-aminoadipic semialdehyde synthase